ncbi:MAG: Mrp/NBP35 family ATP-binding protein [Flavobacteriales bacterium]|nr:Mrp/NBP35 family ATP-binding protein [Flavobacteriales bacterium]
MDLNKINIEKIFKEVLLPSSDKNFFDSKALLNIQIFGNEVLLDIEITNPTLQYKKKIEALCSATIKSNFNNNIKVKVNQILRAVKKENKIKGNPIPGVKNIIAISSGKGGVGKSTIAANLSVALANLNYKVGLIDADIYGPSLPIMFDLVGESPKAVKVEDKNKMEPLTNYGVKMVSMGLFTQANQAIVWRGPMASKALNQLIWDTHWGNLDYLIVDLPPGTGDIHLSLVQAIPLTAAIVVSTPQDIALADARKGVNMFEMDSIDVPVIGIIENMSYFSPVELPNKKYYIFGKDGAKNLADQLNIHLLAQIPIVQSLREASDAGRPAVLQLNSEISKSFINLAKDVVDVVEKRNLNLPSTDAVKITNMKGCS